jgi:ABC-2 type transport system permease protein
MNALHIAFKDLRIFFKDRGAVVLLFLLPLMFIVIFSGALASIGDGGEEDTRILLPVIDLDGGAAAQTLVDGIAGAGGVRVERHTQGDARTLLDENVAGRVLTIPAGFSAGLADNRQVTLRLTSHPDADPQKTEAVRLVIEGVALDMALESQILASLQQMGDMQANVPEEQRAFTPERTIAQARSQFERSRTRPLVAVLQTVPGSEGEREEMPNAIQLSVAGFTIMFVFLTGQTTARSIYDEKRVGSFRRLLAAPISKASLLVGKMIPNFITALVQTAVIFAFGMVGMRLLGLTPLTLGDSPLGVVLVAVLVSLCSSGFGVLIAALARTENQISGLSSVLLWIMGILGGCFVPAFILENFLGPLPMIVPHYWANRAFNDLLVRGSGLADVVTEMVVLLGFTALFFAVGLWRFDFE